MHAPAIELETYALSPKNGATTGGFLHALRLVEMTARPALQHRKGVHCTPVKAFFPIKPRYHS